MEKDSCLPETRVTISCPPMSTHALCEKLEVGLQWCFLCLVLGVQELSRQSSTAKPMGPFLQGLWCDELVGAYPAAPLPGVWCTGAATGPHVSQKVQERLPLQAVADSTVPFPGVTSSSGNFPPVEINTCIQPLQCNCTDVKSFTWNLPASIKGAGAVDQCSL